MLRLPMQYSHTRCSDSMPPANPRCAAWVVPAGGCSSVRSHAMVPVAVRSSVGRTCRAPSRRAPISRRAIRSAYLQCDPGDSRSSVVRSLGVRQILCAHHLGPQSPLGDFPDPVRILDCHRLYLGIRHCLPCAVQTKIVLVLNRHTGGTAVGLTETARVRCR